MSNLTSPQDWVTVLLGFRGVQVGGTDVTVTIGGIQLPATPPQGIFKLNFLGLDSATPDTDNGAIDLQVAAFQSLLAMPESAPYSTESVTPVTVVSLTPPPVTLVQGKTLYVNAAAVVGTAGDAVIDLVQDGASLLVAPIVLPVAVSIAFGYFTATLARTIEAGSDPVTLVASNLGGGGGNQTQIATAYIL